MADDYYFCYKVLNRPSKIRAAHISKGDVLDLASVGTLFSSILKDDHPSKQKFIDMSQGKWLNITNLSNLIYYTYRNNMDILYVANQNDIIQDLDHLLWSWKKKPWDKSIEKEFRVDGYLVQNNESYHNNYLLIE